MQKPEIIKQATVGAEYSYVVAGAKMKCSFGDKEAILTAPFSHGYYCNEKPVLNIMDFKPMVNIMSFGMCSSMTNPTVAAATAAANGKLQKMPCIPMVVTPWLNGKMDVMVENQPAILNNSKNMCVYCGQITIEKDGQE